MRCKMMAWIITLAMLIPLVPASSVLAVPVRTRTVAYRSGSETINGFLAEPQSPGKHPALVVIHEWWGLTPWVKQQTMKLAALGYVSLAVDLYRGQVTTEPSVAHQLARGVPHDRAMRDLQAAFNYLASQPNVDKNRIGDIGWCMGGGYSIELAEIEPHLAACVVNYGALPADADTIQKIHAPVLENSGADDRGITPEMVHRFEAAMKAAGKQANVKIYAGAAHAFENPDNKEGYRPEAARDAWQRIVSFLAQTLGGEP
ncbi:MAG: dienelactone hydrolase family protein [Terriglobia bacterium]